MQRLRETLRAMIRRILPNLPDLSRVLISVAALSLILAAAAVGGASLTVSASTLTGETVPRSNLHLLFAIAIGAFGWACFEVSQVFRHHLHRLRIRRAAGKPCRWHCVHIVLTVLLGVCLLLSYGLPAFAFWIAMRA